MPVSPVSGRLDAFQWKVPLAELGDAREVIEADELTRDRSPVVVAPPPPPSEVPAQQEPVQAAEPPPCCQARRRSHRSLRRGSKR